VRFFSRLRNVGHRSHERPGQDKDKSKGGSNTREGDETREVEERQAAPSNSFLGSELFLFQPQGPFTPPLPSCVPSTDLADFPTSYFSTEASFFNLRDQALCGDWFLVYDNGVLLGASSDPGCVTQQEVRRKDASHSLVLTLFAVY
jgi:hypothetical protein